MQGIVNYAPVTVGMMFASLSSPSACLLARLHLYLSV